MVSPIESTVQQKWYKQGVRWMHVDIAGPAMASKPWGITTPGGTGVPVATVLELLAGDIKTTAG